MDDKYQYYRKTFTYEGTRYTVRGKTKKELNEKVAELTQQLKSGGSGISPNIHAARWCQIWLDEYIKPRVRKPGQPKLPGTMSPKSYDTVYRVKMEEYIIPALGRIKLKDVRDTHLVKILNAQAGKSFSHVSKVRMVMKAAFAQAAASHLIPYDPALNLRLPATEKNTRRSLTDEERRVFDKVAAEDKKHGLFFRVLIGTGIRPGEAVALQVGDLDFNTKTLNICKAVESGTNIISTPKTDAGNRQVPIPDNLIYDLEASVEGKAETDFVFTQVRDGVSMLTSTCVKKYWDSFTRQMDLAMGAEHTGKWHIYDPSDLYPNGSPMYPDPRDKSKPRNGHKLAPDLCLYCLRHTYCTDLQKAGVPLNVAKVLMGHSDISVTANIYSHSSDTDIQAAARLINQYEKKQKNAEKKGEKAG